jgi:hypothetical protein
MVPILKLAQELFVVMDMDAMISLSILLGDLEGAVLAAVVDDHVFPVVVRLCQHALDAFSQEWLCIVYWGDDTDKRTFDLTERLDGAFDWSLTPKAHQSLVAAAVNRLYG